MVRGLQLHNISPDTGNYILYIDRLFTVHVVITTSGRTGEAACVLGANTSLL